MIVYLSLHIALGIALLIVEGNKKHYPYALPIICVGPFLLYAFLIITLTDRILYACRRS